VQIRLGLRRQLLQRRRDVHQMLRRRRRLREMLQEVLNLKFSMMPDV
jgi:hypothetical protein